MVVGDIYPAGDATPNDWDLVALPHWDNIDEDKGSPVGGANEYISASNLNGDNDDLEEFTFTELNNIVDNSITQVKVWIYGVIGSYGGVCYNAISWNDGTTFTAYTDIGLSTLPYEWASTTYGGLSYSKADLDKFQVSLKAGVSAGLSTISIWAVYVEVTYTSSVVGYAHKFCGVLPANIGKISGVATANIGKVKGV